MDIVKRMKPINPSSGRTHEISIIYTRGKACRKSFSVKDARKEPEILESLFGVIQDHCGTGDATHYLSVKNIKTGALKSLTIRATTKLTTKELSKLLFDRLSPKEITHGKAKAKNRVDAEYP